MNKKVLKEDIMILEYDNNLARFKTWSKEGKTIQEVIEYKDSKKKNWEIDWSSNSDWSFTESLRDSRCTLKTEHCWIYDAIMRRQQ